MVVRVITVYQEDQRTLRWGKVVLIACCVSKRMCYACRSLVVAADHLPRFSSDEARIDDIEGLDLEFGLADNRSSLGYAKRCVI